MSAIEMEYKEVNQNNYWMFGIVNGKCASQVSWSLETEEEFYTDEEGDEFSEDFEYVLVDGVGTAPAYRRQGFARVTLRAALERIEADFPGMPIRLSAHPQEEDGISYDDLVAFYESEGFQVIFAGDVVVMER